MMSSSHARSSVDTIPIVSQVPIHSTLFRVESIPLNANAQPGEPKSRRSVPSCASTAVLQMLLPHEVTTAVALGLSLVFLARQAVGLACLLLVDGLFLLGLQLGVNLGTLGGLVAVDLGLLRLCQRNALDSHRVSGSHTGRVGSFLDNAVSLSSLGSSSFFSSAARRLAMDRWSSVVLVSNVQASEIRLGNESHWGRPCSES